MAKKHEVEPGQSAGTNKTSRLFCFCSQSVEDVVRLGPTEFLQFEEQSGPPLVTQSSQHVCEFFRSTRYLGDLPSDRVTEDRRLLPAV